MARKQRAGGATAAEKAAAVAVSEALLFTTVCMVGLPVEAQVKDGSLYSGVFHTASLRDGYGIVLKKARKIGHGKCDTNIAVGALIDTLVILSSDLVQIVVKEFALPAEGIAGNVAGDSVKAATRAIEPRGCSRDFEGELNSVDEASLDGNLDQMLETKSLSGSNIVEDGKANEVPTIAIKNGQKVEDGRQESEHLKKVEESYLIPSVSVEGRQAGEDKPEEEEDSCYDTDDLSIANTKVQEFNCSSPSNASLSQVNFINKNQTNESFKATSCGRICGSPAAVPPRQYATVHEFPASVNIPSSDVHNMAVSTSYTSVSDDKFSSYGSHSELPNPSVSESNSICNVNAKEFKLNPGAKVFTPSYANYRSIPALANPAYMSNSLPVVAVNVGQAGSEISSFSSNSSLPTKVVQYNNLVSVQSGTVPQYSRPILPHAGTRQLPLRFTDQHHPVQSAPAFVHPNSQTVTVGRLGQLVYVQPVTQDATPGTTVFSQGIPNQMLSPYHANIPKLQGATIQPLQLCMTPPIMAGASQPFLAPTHVPFPQPFPAIRPILVPGGNGFPACKFQ